MYVIVDKGKQRVCGLVVFYLHFTSLSRNSSSHLLGISCIFFSSRLSFSYVNISFALKWTFLLIINFLWVGCHLLKPFIPSMKPTNMHLIALAFSFPWFWWTYTTHPNTLRSLRFGGWLDHFASGVKNPKEVWGLLFSVYIA